MQYDEYTEARIFSSYNQTIKLQQCPYCKTTGNLNLHGYLWSTKEPNNIRARRIYCSNRGNRSGCGRTYAVYKTNIIPNLSISADKAWSFLTLLLTKLSFEKAYYDIFDLNKISIDTIYRFWRRFRLNLFKIRTNLFILKKPPIPAADPYRETIIHLKSISCNNPISYYQQKFQTAFC